MNIKWSLILFICASLGFFGCKVKLIDSKSMPVSHQIWDELVHKHVQLNGNVDYKGFLQDSVRLNEYLAILSQSHPNNKNWSSEQRMAYWINAYNAFTIQLVIRNYPVPSIKEIRPGIAFVNSVWDIKFIEIEGQVYDLNNIEHGILRQYWKEPRVHFALNCASVSCPALRNEAYTAEKLEGQLNDQGKRFLSNPIKNQISASDPKISPIFKWFKGDFTRKGSLIDFLNKFSPVEIDSDAKVDHMSYDWNLNDIG